jgi:hypothetical protein
MADDKTTLRQAVEDRGGLAVWDLMTDDEKKAAAVALWENADRESRMAVEMLVAKEMKFRPQSVRKLSAEQVAPRLARMAAELPETVFFQFLFHLHMAERRPLMVAYLDAVGLPHQDGVLDLAEDDEAPTEEAAAGPSRELIAEHGREALVYLATLGVADPDFWAGMLPVLEDYDENGDAIGS